MHKANKYLSNTYYVLDISSRYFQTSKDHLLKWPCRKLQHRQINLANANPKSMTILTRDMNTKSEPEP